MGEDQLPTGLMTDAVCLPIFDGGNIGIRRKHLERFLPGLIVPTFARLFTNSEVRWVL